ncbi:hypothetical protein STRAU_1030 [Streptomyces aurantiacus JA 4570]|uniref:Secreted protein n=1 Tax=Streptomyces aurantiacus JA 4570 TaxID=1286094 RepID=S3ZSY0_9ACTN|nr:hypothetical protein STRAU_1030 [Streptomyces aurantiacus JA 4570]
MRRHVSPPSVVLTVVPAMAAARTAAVVSALRRMWSPHFPWRAGRTRRPGPPGTAAKRSNPAR